MRNARWALPAALLLALSAGGCGFVVFNQHQTIVQSDLRLPGGVRVVVTPFLLYNFPADEMTSTSSDAYSVVSGAMMRAGFHVVERSVVEKALQNPSAKPAAARPAASAPGGSDIPPADAAFTPPPAAALPGADKPQDAVIDFIGVAKALNVRLVLLGSVTSANHLFASAEQVRLRVVDVSTGELLSHCEGSGRPSVLEVCAQSMASQLAAMKK